MTSTGGTVPSARLRFADIRRIHPSVSGLGIFPFEYSIEFWPGCTSTGPNSKCRCWVPAGNDGSAGTLVSVAPDTGGAEADVAAAVVPELAAGESFAPHATSSAATASNPTTTTVRRTWSGYMWGLSS